MSKLVVDNRDFGPCMKCNGTMKFLSANNHKCNKCGFVIKVAGLYGGPTNYFFRRYITCPKCQRQSFETDGQRGSLLCCCCGHTANSHPCYVCKQSVIKPDNPQYASYYKVGPNTIILHPVCLTNESTVEGKLTGCRKFVKNN